MADILKKGPLMALCHQRQLEPFLEYGGDRFEHAFLSLVFIVAPVSRGNFHCHRQAASSFLGRPIDLSPPFPARFLLDDSCNLGCTCNITPYLSLGDQTLEELYLQVRAVCPEQFNVVFAEKELCF
jgi:hypothetical protein